MAEVYGMEGNCVSQDHVLGYLTSKSEGLQGAFGAGQWRLKEVDEDLEAVTWELESLRRVEVEVQLREWSVERSYASLRELEEKETTAENISDDLSERVTRLEEQVRAKKAELGVERRWLAVQEDRVASLESALAVLRERETEVEWRLMEREIGDLRL